MIPFLGLPKAGHGSKLDIWTWYPSIFAYYWREIGCGGFPRHPIPSAAGLEVAVSRCLNMSRCGGLCHTLYFRSYRIWKILLPKMRAAEPASLASRHLLFKGLCVMQIKNKDSWVGLVLRGIKWSRGSTPHLYGQTTGKNRQQFQQNPSREEPGLQDSDLV